MEQVIAAAVEEGSKARRKKLPVTHAALAVGKRHAGVRKGEAGERKTPGAHGKGGRAEGGGTMSGVGRSGRVLVIQQETPSTKNSSNVCSPMVDNAAILRFAMK